MQTAIYYVRDRTFLVILVPTATLTLHTPSPTVVKSGRHIQSYKILKQKSPPATTTPTPLDMQLLQVSHAGDGYLIAY